MAGWGCAWAVCGVRKKYPVKYMESVQLLKLVSLALVIEEFYFCAAPATFLLYGSKNAGGAMLQSPYQESEAVGIRHMVGNSLSLIQSLRCNNLKI